MAGTAELDRTTEFVFFRLCLTAYESGNCNVLGSDARLAMRCKTPIDEFKIAIELLTEIGKIIPIDGGYLVPSTQGRLEDAKNRISARQRGAAISRRRMALKAEDKPQAEIDLIIRREFFGDQADDQADIYKTRQDKTEKGKASPSSSDVPALFDDDGGDLARAAVDMWNESCASSGLPRVQMLNAKRRRGVMARLGECGGLEGWRVALEKVAASDFLTGRTGKSDWRATFDFLCQPSSFAKLMEGAYDNRGGFDRGRRGSAVMDELRGMGDA